MPTLRAIAVYCGSSPGDDPRYAQAAHELGAALAARHINLVYGGGHVGLMGVIAQAAFDGGAHVTGVITNSLMERELGNGDVTELIRVDTMHERKSTMSKLADAFVMLPGGYGTLDEFFEAVTWTQLGIHDKPCAIFDPVGYYEPLLAFIDHANREGFISTRNRALIQSYATVDDLLSALQS